MGRNSGLAAVVGCVIALAPACFVDLDPLQSGATSSGGAASSTGTLSTGGSGGVAATGGGGGSGASGGAGSTGGGAPQPPWWKTKYPRRFRLDVHDVGGAGLPTGLQVQWAGSTSAIAPAANSGGMRLARYDAGNGSWEEKAFVIDQTPSDNHVWFTLDVDVQADAHDTSYWLYGADTNPPPPFGSPSDVFPDLYAQFAMGLGGWQTNGSPSFGSSGLTLDSPGASVRSDVKFSPGHAVDWGMRFVATFSAATNGWMGGGFQRTSDFNDSEPWLIWINRQPGKIQAEAQLDAVGEGEKAPAVSYDDLLHVYGVERYGSHAVYLRDDAVDVSLGPWPGGAFAQDLQVRFMNTDDTDTGSILVPWARVRRCVDPPPDVTLGAEEDLP